MNADSDPGRLRVLDHEFMMAFARIASCKTRKNNPLSAKAPSIRSCAVRGISILCDSAKPINNIGENDTYVKSQKWEIMRFILM